MVILSTLYVALLQKIVIVSQVQAIQNIRT